MDLGISLQKQTVGIYEDVPQNTNLNDSGKLRHNSITEGKQAFTYMALTKEREEDKKNKYEYKVMRHGVSYIS